MAITTSAEDVTTIGTIRATAAMSIASWHDDSNRRHWLVITISVDDATITFTSGGDDPSTQMIDGDARNGNGNVEDEDPPPLLTINRVQYNIHCTCVRAEMGVDLSRALYIPDMRVM